MSDEPIDQVAALRTNRKASNLDATPREVLNAVLADIVKGETSPEGILIIQFAKDERGHFQTKTYRANVRWNDEIVLLSAALNRVLNP